MRPLTLIFIAGISILSACNKGNGIPPKTLSSPEWLALVGMAPPADAKWTAQSKVENVEVYGIISSNPITMPLLNAPGVKDYLALPVENTKAFVENALGIQVEGARGALFSEWEVGQYLYRGTILRAGSGDYMVIEKYPK